LQPNGSWRTKYNETIYTFYYDGFNIFTPLNTTVGWAHIKDAPIAIEQWLQVSQEEGPSEN